MRYLCVLPEDLRYRPSTPLILQAPGRLRTYQAIAEAMLHRAEPTALHELIRLKFGKIGQLRSYVINMHSNPGIFIRFSAFKNPDTLERAGTVVDYAEAHRHSFGLRIMETTSHKVPLT